MENLTALDIAHNKMAADPNNDAARLAFYGALADAELFLLLEKEAEGETILPEILELEEDSYALVFDSEERLAEFTKSATPYGALPGRVIAAMLAGQNIGMGLNLGVAPSSILIPAEAMQWLTETLSETPTESIGRGRADFTPLGDENHALLHALQDKLRFAGGHVNAAYLAKLAKNASGDTARNALILGLVDVEDTHHQAIAHAAQEVLTFSGDTQQSLDVVFLTANTSTAQALAKFGTPLDLPVPDPEPEPVQITAPGSDPDKPPNLR